MATEVNPTAAALSALTLSARILKALADKHLLSVAEVQQIIRQNVSEIAPGDPELNQACRTAMQAVFPRMDI